MASPRALAVSTPGSPSTARQPQVYQIDFTAVASGKRIASTKRRVRWRFGFANPEALASGETGTACRGEEHDVTIVWSITSGKRLVLADGQEVHYSNSRNNVFDFSWTMRGNHVLKVVAHASPPVSATPGFRQYDFFVDGQSFFSFPKVYRLGLAPNDPRAMASPHTPPSLADRGRNYNSGGGRNSGRNYGSGGVGGSVRSTGSANIASLEAPHNPDEEEMYLQEAIKNSLVENAKPPPSSGASVQSAPPTTGATDNLLLDIFDSSAPAPNTAAPLPALPPPGPAVAPSYPPPATSQSYPALPAPNDAFGAAPHQPAGAYPALGAPSSAPTSSGTYNGGAADPFAGAPAPVGFGAPTPAPGGFGAPAPAPAGFGAPSSTPAGFGPPAPYGEAAFAPGNPAGYGAQPQQTYQPHQQAFGQQPPPPTPAAAPPATAPPATAPAFGQQQQPTPFGSPEPPPSSIPVSASNFTPTTQTSSLGFASPTEYAQNIQQSLAGQTNGTFNQPAEEPPQQQPDPAPVPSDPALLSMNVLSGQQPNLVSEPAKSNGGSMADQAYAKLVNMDAFDLVKGGEQERQNPFEAASNAAMSQVSLSDMKSKNSNSGQKKEIMKASPGALVVSSTQSQGNYGGYGNQFASTMGQQPMAQQMMGQQPMAHQPMAGYGMPQQGQQQQYGQFQQQPQYGQHQQYAQQPQYGQPPPLQQQFGQAQQFGGF